MLTKIHIQNFRSFRDVEVGPFKRVNLIAGLNNAGKTGLLEAIFLGVQSDQPVRGAKRPSDLPNLFRVFSAQADLNQDFWPWLFRDRNVSKPIEIAVADDAGWGLKFFLGVDRLKQSSGPAATLSFILGNYPGLQWRPSVGMLTVAVFASHPSDPVQDAIDYNRVVLKKAKKTVEGLMRQVDPRLQTIEALQTGSRPLIYADIGLAEMIPVSHLGEGFCRLLDIYSEILAGEAKVLLIDEVENGLHHSVMPIVWKGLMAAAEELDVQIFATTHSAECIFAADRAARERVRYDLNLIRLDRVEGEIKATIVDEEGMETARELHWELR
jgi:hypothetical protein